MEGKLYSRVIIGWDMVHLKNCIPWIYSIATVPTANLEGVKGQQELNITFRKYLTDWKLERVGEFFNTGETFQGFTDDTLHWNNCRNGIFTVRSAYLLSLMTGQLVDQWPWKYIWRVKAPIMVVCFSWLVARDSCLTQENLKRRGLQLCSRCLMCKANRESNSHLFMHCPISVQLSTLSQYFGF